MSPVDSLQDVNGLDLAFVILCLREEFDSGLIDVGLRL